MRPSQIQIRLMGVLTILVLLLTFSRARFAIPTLYAEEGQVFLSEAFQLGWKALVTPYAGYYHTVPRLFSAMATWLPFRWIPFFFQVGALGVTAWCMSLWLRSGYSWLFSRWPFAILFVVLLPISAGAWEVLGNLTNLHWVLITGAFASALRSSAEPWTWEDWLIWSLAAASSGSLVLVLPVLLVRGHSNRREVAVAAGFALVFLVLNQLAPQFRSVSVQSLNGELLLTLLRGLFWDQVVGPLLGSFLSLRYYSSTGTDFGLQWSILLVWLGVLVFGLSRQPRGYRSRWIALVVFPSLYFSLVLVARDGAGAVVGGSDAAQFWIHRYHFIPSFLGWLAIGGLFNSWSVSSRFSRPRWKWIPWTVAAIVIAMRVHKVRELEPYRPDSEWEKYSVALEARRQGLTSEPVEVPIAPPGWHFRYAP